jgi:hypothetical protein
MAKSKAKPHGVKRVPNYAVVSVRIVGLTPYRSDRFIMDSLMRYDDPDGDADPHYRSGTNKEDRDGQAAE